MALCRFYQQGYCKFGSNCRFEHPNASGNNRNQASNRFGALGGGGGGGGGGPAGGSGGGNESALEKYSITAETIEKDLTIDVPQWILSAYGPGRDAPDQLFGGFPREQSFEELRLHYLVGKASGNEQQALNDAQQLYQDAKQQMENAARNADEAARFIVEGENRHPNRHDICQERTQGAPFGEFLIGRRPNANPFGGNASATSAFGQPSALGQTSNPFGQPSQSAFGQPSQPTSSFGQPAQPAQQTSAFGQPAQSTPTFGQPSQPTSAFGQPAQASAFGQPSALGAKPSPFGTPAFGQAPQANTQNNPFGQPQPQPQNAQGSAFGQPSQLGQKPNPFASAVSSGAGPFAAAGNNNAPASNPFAAPSSGQGGPAPTPFASNTSNNTASPFGQQAQQQAPNPFGQPSAPAANPFASTNQGSTQNASNPFAQQPQQPQQQSAFGTQANQPSGTGSGLGQSNASPFGQPPRANPFGQNQANGNSGQANTFTAAQPQQQASSGGPYRPGSAKQHPPIDSYSSKGMDGQLTMFKGKPVTCKNGQPGNRAFDGTWARIWFPDGPPTYNKDTELHPQRYGDKTKVQWVKFLQTGAFADGLIPELPPPRECTQWDF